MTPNRSSSEQHVLQQENKLRVASISAVSNDSSYYVFSKSNVNDDRLVGAIVEDVEAENRTSDNSIKAQQTN